MMKNRKRSETEEALLLRAREKFNHPKNNQGGCLIVKRMADAYRPYKTKASKNAFNEWYLFSLLKGCALTGVDFRFRTGGIDPFSPSIDKTNNENPRLICYWANVLRNNRTDGQFRKDVQQANVVRVFVGGAYRLVHQSHVGSCPLTTQ
ncbi:MAG: hypothetical protein ACYSWP_15750 [Planctomycetota bacterium]|jgi:hypothetical protein